MKKSKWQLGSRIKTARLEKKLTQEQLAEIMNISTNYVSEIESKNRLPSADVLLSMCVLLNVSLDDEIFGKTSDPIRKLTRKLSQCSDKQLKLINNLIDTVLDYDSHD